MRYLIRIASPPDLACVARVAKQSLEDRGALLSKVCDLSSRIWIASRTQNVPDVLFGVAPLEDDPETGEFWVFFFNAFAMSDRDQRDVMRLVVDEMLTDFVCLESRVDPRKTWLLDTMKAIGFTIEPTAPRGLDVACHVWRAFSLGGAPLAN